MTAPAALAATLLALALLAGVVCARYTEPAALPVDAPAAGFSAGRARAVLGALLGDGAAHPVGSAAADRVRGRVVAELSRLGYAPAVYDAWTCTGSGTCARVRDVTARLDAVAGTPPAAGAVLVCAHYDSVGAGPGASDDGSGVAVVLEVARALRAGGPLRRPVLFLLDEGEEAGLLGAQAFAEGSPAMGAVRAVVNLDARGTRGPSALFEVTPAGAGLVGAVTAALPRPVTASSFYEVYRRMPNNTDLTVFRRHGVAGVNLAFLGGVQRYHTPRDDLAHVSAGSLQHQGDHALAAVRALALADLERPPRGAWVWFDVLALFVVRWPAGWTLPLALAALALLAAARRRRTTEGARTAPAAWGLLGGVAAPLASAAGGLGVGALLHAAGGLATPWPAHPGGALVALFAVPFACGALTAARLRERAGAAGLWAGVWWAWALAAVALAATLPSMAYLYVVPALVAGVAGVAAPRATVAVTVVPAFAAACLWLPLLVMLPDALGLAVPAVYPVLLGVMVTPLLPLFALDDARWRRALLAVPLAAMAAGVIAAACAAPYSTESPRRIRLVLHEDADAHTARWLAGASWGIDRGVALPPTLAAAAPFGPRAVQGFAWEATPAWVAPTAWHALPPPELAVLGETAHGVGRTVRARLRSPRGGNHVTLLVPAAAALTALRFGPDGQRVEPASTPGWRRYDWLTVPPEGLELTLDCADRLPMEAVLLDRSPALPPDAEALLRARPAWAVTSQDGDGSVVSRRVRW